MRHVQVRGKILSNLYTTIYFDYKFNSQCIGRKVPEKRFWPSIRQFLVEGCLDITRVWKTSRSHSHMLWMSLISFVNFDWAKVIVSEWYSSDNVAWKFRVAAKTDYCSKIPNTNQAYREAKFDSDSRPMAKAYTDCFS